MKSYGSIIFSSFIGRVFPLEENLTIPGCRIHPCGRLWLDWRCDRHLVGGLVHFPSRRVEQTYPISIVQPRGNGCVHVGAPEGQPKAVAYKTVGHGLSPVVPDFAPKSLGIQGSYPPGKPRKVRSYQAYRFVGVGGWCDWLRRQQLVFSITGVPAINFES